MREILTYAVSSIFLSGILYALFRAFLQSEKSFSFNRRLLLILTILSIILPGLSLTGIFSVREDTLPVPEKSVTQVVGKTIDKTFELRKSRARYETASQEALRAQPTDEELQNDFEPAEEFPYEDIFLNIYLIISAGSIFWLSSGIRKIVKLNSRGALSRFPGYSVRFVDELISPFSFWKTIFIPKGVYTEEEIELIVLHERAHIEQRHVVDLILLEIACAVAWFNPFLRLYKMSMVELHEYSADKAALAAGVSAKEYCDTLYKNLTGEKMLAPSHYLNKDQIKRRLRMMYSGKDGSLACWKYAFFIPAVILLFYTFSFSSVEYRDADNLHVFLSSKLDVNPKPGDHGPIYPGGEAAIEDFLLQFRRIREYVKLNDNANEVATMFYVDVTGKAEGMKEGRLSVDKKRYRYSGLDEQKLSWAVDKALLQMPRFEPAVKNGQKTRCMVSLTVNLSDLNIAPREIDSNRADLDAQAKYPGSYADYVSYINKNLRMPKEAKKKGATGRISIVFYVEPDGRITEPKLLEAWIDPGQSQHSEPYGFTDEAIRLASQMPRWRPAIKNGKPVRSKEMITVNFGDEKKLYSR